MLDGRYSAISCRRLKFAHPAIHKQALAINPRTFSPEVLLSVARVVQPPDITTGKGVLIRQIQRPTDSENAFAFGFAGTSGDGEREEEGEEHVEWRDVLAAEWRLLDL